MADEPPSSNQSTVDEEPKSEQDVDSAEGERGNETRESQSVSIAEMEACLENGNAFNRELVARVILETLRSIPYPDTHHDLSRVLAIISRLGEDPEPSVRAELMEQVPHVAMYCHEEKDSHQWMHLVPSFLLPLVVRYLTDVNNQVRKTAQAALLVLLEQELVARNDVEDQVCPLLLMLTNSDAHDDFRTEAAALMCRMAPLLGGDLSRRVFLDRFAALCSDGLFHVRKICAANFGEFSAVVGQEITEAVLLEKFYALCQDELWGVRKACAEVFMSLSRVVSVTKRRHDLGILFVNLLQDDTRWVRMAAFQALGPFISTFSRPEDDMGKVDQEDSTSSIGSSDSNHLGSSLTSDKDVDESKSLKEADQHFNSFYYWRDPLPELDLDDAISKAPTKRPELDDSTTTAGATDRGDQEGNHSSMEQSGQADMACEFVSDSVEKALEDLMARVELGPIEPVKSVADHTAPESNEGETVHAFDLRRVACQELLGVKSDSASSESDENDTVTESIANDLSSKNSQSPFLSSDVHSPVLQPNVLLPPAYVKTSSEFPTVYSNSFYTYYPRRRSDGGLDGRPRPCSPFQRSATNYVFQNIVPQNLMDYYLQMTDPYYVETVDAEITRHCAYSLPAVVCTLGKEHWPLLRDLYGTLASDMQWKVRRTLASSIHEIGAILGQDVVTQDLVPVFDELIKDLDEVRIGVLKHLGEFLRLLPETDRRSYLPRLADFLKLDNEQNWRFRQELALQLQTVVSLFSPPDIAQSIVPLALALAADRVADVRNSAFTLVSEIMKQVSQTSWEGSSVMLTSLVNELTTRFCSGNRWMLRQSYINICNQLMTDRSLPLEEFARQLLTPLLSLRRDRVPNVRLVLARVINFQLKYNDFFAGTDSPYRETLNEVLMQLSADEDRDVSYFASVNREKHILNSTSLHSVEESAA